MCEFCPKCGRELSEVEKMSDLNMNFEKLNKACKEVNETWREMMKENNPFDTISEIAKDIADRKDKEVALEFTKDICALLKNKGVSPVIDEYKQDIVKENSIEHKYGVEITGLDFTEHDKKFNDEIESLKRQIEKLESIRTRCHESARDSFDLGNYGCLHIVTADELKNSNENVAKIESELFDAQKSADEYYNKCIDLTNQIEKLKSELETKVDFETDGLVKLPIDPLGTANMLINATYKAEIPFLERQVDRNVYDINDLEQIAEHLLVYCKHNREDEE